MRTAIRAAMAWAPVGGLVIGVAEWMLGETTGGPRSLVWTACAFALVSTAAALVAVALAARLRFLVGLDPLGLWLWFWLGVYGVIHANITILPRQSFLTPPSIALTLGALAGAAVLAWAAAGLIGGSCRRLDRPFVMPAGAAVAAGSLLLVIAIPLTLPRPDLTQHHSPRGPGQRSALLIVVDTMRADHLSCYGYHRPTSPAIDALAALGARFDAAWSSSSWTVPAVASLFSGLPLSAHRAGAADTPFDTEPTLAGLLSRAGLVTAGLSSNYLVSPLYGFERGFDLFVSDRTGLVHPVLDLCAGTILSRVLRRGMDSDRMAVDQAKVWLRAHRGDRFFLYLHLFAPHRPYAPPSAFRERFVDPAYRGIQYEGAANGETLEPPALENAIQRYDAEIAYADSMVGEMVESIARLGLDESTLVIVTSDHGEAFGEHGHWEHGQTLYAEETRIPLVVRLPGGAASRVIGGPVSLADLYPTLLDLLDARAVAQVGSSVSLAPSLTEGSEPPLHPVVSELLGREGTIHPETYEAVTMGDARLVRSVTRRSTELFDWVKDPHEVRPVDNPELSRMLQAYLAPRWWEAAASVAARRISLSDEDQRRLRSLGYIR